jgi:galactose oxidase-like protein
MTPKIRSLWPLVLGYLLLAGCGGGGSGSDSSPPPPQAPAISSFAADQSAYFVGNTARLTAVFQGGNGRLDPGNMAIVSGQAVTTPILTDDVAYKLTVSNGTSSVSREITLDVSYRERMRTIAMPFSRNEHEAVTVPDGRVLIVGGDSFGETLPPAVYQFEPSNETFTKLGDLSTGRVGMVATALANGDVLVALGGRALMEAPPAEIMNGRTGAVSPTLGNPSHARHYASGTLLTDGRVLIAGGHGNSGADPTAEIFDPATGLFTLLPATMAKGRFSHSATRLDDGRVLIYGGHTNDNRPAPPEVFDPATATFVTLAAVEPNGRALHSAVKSSDGRVWILGGEDNDSTPLASVLRFDAETHFALGPDLASPRTMLAAAPLSDGRLLISGGASTYALDEVQSSSELVRNLQVRTNGPAMSAARITHTVTPLSNGKLLIVGGYNREGGVLATAEIFE